MHDFRDLREVPVEVRRRGELTESSLKRISVDLPTSLRLHALYLSGQRSDLRLVHFFHSSVVTQGLFELLDFLLHRDEYLLRDAFRLRDSRLRAPHTVLSDLQLTAQLVPSPLRSPKGSLGLLHRSLRLQEALLNRPNLSHCLHRASIFGLVLTAYVA